MFRKTHTLLLFLPFLLLPLLCTSTDTITSNITIKDGDVLVSNGKSFVLGFFSPGSSAKRYVGIWYNNVSEQTVVWVANRDSPLNDTSGALSIHRTGNLVIHGSGALNNPVWSTNVSVPELTNAGCSAQLLDTGNLVLYRDDTKTAVAWQSFDHPTHTMLPYMKLGVDRRTGLNRFLTSWKSRDDPGTGGYQYRIDMTGIPQLFLFKGSDRLWRAGPWNGVRWTGVPEMTPNFIFNVTYVDNRDELFVMYGIHNASIFSRMTVSESGVVERLTWHERDRRWIGFWSAPKDRCDNYNECGPFGDCNERDAGEFECMCLPGFEPRLPRDWYLRDASGGCVRKRGGHVCRNGEGFVKVASAKLPDTSAATRVEYNGAGLGGCEEKCLKDCSCVAYTSADVRGSGTGCMTWHGKLVDTREFTGGGQDLYIRVDAVELAQYSKPKGNHGKKIVVILAASIASLLLLVALVSYWVMFKRKEAANLLFSSTSLEDSSMGKEFDESSTRADLPFFDLSTIVAATDNFSPDNKLGEGGFGSVYKGRLNDGQEIAIKRLAKHSGQGIEEFKNEVSLIAKLQHRNLVRLVGYCTKKEEKMLIYEFLPNKGLDTVIFDKEKASLVDWKKRFEIILGIARGMLYLHQDSRLRIIHRDLKASNVLLDAAMNPKISDFGMARIFGADQIEANTNRVVGTYGYMSPEYAMAGQFSIKSDVFSFGVLLLEIVTGRKNNSYYQEDSVNLIGHVWDLWRAGQLLDIVDSSLGDSCEEDDVLRCVHIGLLCVQEAAADRPTMSTVLFMLSSGTVLPPPKQPAFILKRPNRGADTSSTSVGSHSVNDVTVTMMEAR